jgi:hypothetical protein
VSIAEEARGRRGPRRGRSSALARSIGLDQPKKEGPGADQFSGASHKIACAPALANQFRYQYQVEGEVLFRGCVAQFRFPA